MNIKSISKIWAILIIMVFGYGCATTPAYQEMAKFDYGQPLTIDYEKAIKDYMETELKDAYSAQYKFGTPYQGWAKEPPHLFNGTETTGYFIPVGINAKNSFGGYVGYKSYLFVFKNNQLVKIFPPESIEWLKLSKNPSPLPEQPVAPSEAGKTAPQPFSKQVATPPVQPKAIKTSPIEQRTPATVGKKESYGYAPAEEPPPSKVLINPDTGAVMNIKPGDKQAGFVEIEKLPSVGIKLPKNNNAENGIIIEGVYQGSPAAKAGLKAGDMIVEKNGQPVQTLSELKSQRRQKMGDIVEYKIIRGGREMVFSMTTVPFADILKTK